MNVLETTRSFRLAHRALPIALVTLVTPIAAQQITVDHTALYTLSGHVVSNGKVYGQWSAAPGTRLPGSFGSQFYNLNASHGTGKGGTFWARLSARAGVPKYFAPVGGKLLYLSQAHVGGWTRFVLQCSTPTPALFRASIDGSEGRHPEISTARSSGSARVRVIAGNTVVYDGGPTASLPVVIGPKGVEIQIRAWRTAYKNSFDIHSGIDSRTTAYVEVTPYPVTYTKFGTGCGPELSGEHPDITTLVTKVKGGASNAPGAILYGVRPIDLPLWGCHLLVEPLVLLPIRFDAAGHFTRNGRMTLVKPLTLYMQAVSFGQKIETSNGLLLFIG